MKIHFLSKKTKNPGHHIRVKQLFAYCGMDPEVKQSGKFNAMEVHMSIHDSRFARRAIFAAALACVRLLKFPNALSLVP